MTLGDLFYHRVTGLLEIRLHRCLTTQAMGSVVCLDQQLMPPAWPLVDSHRHDLAVEDLTCGVLVVGDLNRHRGPDGELSAVHQSEIGVHEAHLRRPRGVHRQFDPKVNQFGHGGGRQLGATHLDHRHLRDRIGHQPSTVGMSSMVPGRTENGSRMRFACAIARHWVASP